MAKQSVHSAEPMIQGVFLQLERALFHLCHCGHGEAVAVELVDDVSRHKNGKVSTREQDKNTLDDDKRLFANRSLDIWRTLQIWTNDFRASGSFCSHYLLVTNTQATGTIADALRADVSIPDRANAILAAMNDAAQNGRVRRKSRATSKIQAIIDDVMALPSHNLQDLVSRVELVEEFNYKSMRQELATRLGISPDVEREAVLTELMGWMVETLKAAWDAGAPGIITKEACLRQIDAIERRMVRRRLLPRPSSEVLVGESQVQHARGRKFVEHLSLIEVGDDEILQAIEHFVQFNAERHRLANEGEIPIQEWTDRGSRLKQRWQNVTRQVRLNHSDKSRVQLGKHVFAETTYHHREALAGLPCDELYMTSGHYHRLADDNLVWWDPEFPGV
ncbi:ABC-three component system protein [Roseibium album]|uniref:ABC-three component system protein n=1 Tax=Roseibium album TaxID=311410 RepID=UPI003BAEA8EE